MTTPSAQIIQFPLAQAITASSAAQPEAHGTTAHKAALCEQRQAIAEWRSALLDLQAALKDLGKSVEDYSQEIGGLDDKVTAYRATLQK